MLSLTPITNKILLNGHSRLTLLLSDSAEKYIYILYIKMYNEQYWTKHCTLFTNPCSTSDIKIYISDNMRCFLMLCKYSGTYMDINITFL